MAKECDPTAFVELFSRLIKETGESYRRIARGSGLTHVTLSNYMKGVRPSRGSCVVLADHFRINPNVMIEAANYEPLQSFSQAFAEPMDISADVREMAIKVQQIPSLAIRTEIAHFADTLINLYVQGQGTPPSRSSEDLETPEFPVWLQEKIDEQNINASGVARKIEVSYVTVGRWLRGERQPGDSSIAKLAGLFAVSTTEVYAVLGRIPAPEGDPALAELNALWERLPEWKQQDLL